MLDSILKKINEELTAKLVVLGVDHEKYNYVIMLAKKTIVNHLRNYSSEHTVTETGIIFKSTKPLESHPLVQQMMASYRAGLIDKLSISSKEANAVSEFIIPFILMQVSHRVNQNPASLQVLLKGGFLNRINLKSVLTFNLI